MPSPSVRDLLSCRNRLQQQILDDGYTGGKKPSPAGALQLGQTRIGAPQPALLGKLRGFPQNPGKRGIIQSLLRQLGQILLGILFQFGLTTLAAEKHDTAFQCDLEGFAH